MIGPGGVELVTAAQAIERLGSDITPEMIRDWVRRGILQPHSRARGMNVFRLLDVMDAEARTRGAVSGRPRRDPSGLTLQRENVTISRSHVTLVNAAQVPLSSSRCTVVTRTGRGCDAFVPATAPIPNCAEHLHEAFLWYADQLSGTPQRQEITRIPVGAARAPEPAAGEGIIYYLRFGDRIKIGFSRNVAQRLAAVPHDELIAYEPGPPELEKMRHQQFEELKVARREWFREGPELLSHIAMLREHYGEPDVSLVPAVPPAPHELAETLALRERCPSCNRRSLQRQMDVHTMQFGPVRCVSKKCSGADDVAQPAP